MMDGGIFSCPDAGMGCGAVFAPFLIHPENRIIHILKITYQWLIDNNELKHNMFSPGSSIPIISFEKGMKIKPDIIFILAWNFKDEIIQSCTNHGYKGSFFIPLPNTPYLH